MSSPAVSSLVSARNRVVPAARVTGTTTLLAFETVGSDSAPGVTEPAVTLPLTRPFTESASDGAPSLTGYDPDPDADVMSACSSLGAATATGRTARGMRTLLAPGPVQVRN